MNKKLQESIWQSEIRNAGLQGLDEILWPEALPCFRVNQLIPDVYSEVGKSRFGGEPDLPLGFEWPQDEEAAMTFLAQIDLAELLPNFIPDLPKQGWLYFFLGHDDNQWYPVSHQVHYFDGPPADLKRQGPPADAPQVWSYNSRTFKPHIVTFGPQFSIDYYSPVWEKLGAPYDEPPEKFYQERTQIRGHQLFFNGDPALSAYVYKNALPKNRFSRRATDEYHLQAIDAAMERGDTEYAEKLKKKLKTIYEFQTWLQQHESNIDLWLPLFILESHCPVGMLWADAGLLSFMIHREDLLANRFDNTFCHLMST